MEVNDNADYLNERAACTFFASRLAPTKADRRVFLLLQEQSVALRTVAHDTLLSIFL